MDKIIEFNSEFKPDWDLAKENLEKEEEKLNKIVKEILRWIPATERLPEKHGRYLVTGKWGDLEIATYIKDTNQWAIGWHNKDIPKEIGVIAWMPLPEAYKEN